MSAFKRYRSKVFWNHMERQDLGNSPFPRKESAITRARSPICGLEDSGEKNDLDSSSVHSEDSSAENITVICVPQNVDGRQEHSRVNTAMFHEEGATSFADVAEEADKDTEVDTVLRNRSCTPLSQDLRSQDSGFSDSERSNCSETYRNETPRRRRRKKLQDRRTRTHAKIGSLWTEDVPANPTCTSTPKDSRISSHRSFLDFEPSLHESPLEKSEDERTEVDGTPVMFPLLSLEEESLGDFLYAAEPPEDRFEPKSLSNSSEKASRLLLERQIDRQSSAVRSWLKSLSVEVEDEYGTTLQSKSLPRRQWNEVGSMDEQASDLKALSSAATAGANRLLARVEQFDRNYFYVLDKVSHLENLRSQKDLVRALEDDAYSILCDLGAPPARRIQQGSLKSTLYQLEHIKEYVNSILDTRLDFYIERVIRGLEEAPKEDSSVARGALAALTVLGLAGPRAGSSIARCSGVRVLLTSLISAKRTSNDFVAASLRALASVCSSAMAIEQFVNDGGPEILADLLTNQSSPERERMEATALLVQITAPWTDAVGLPYMEPYADALITALRRLVESTSCSQTLLLAAAALNQLSKSKRCAFAIIREDAVRKLLRSVKQTVGSNVWLMEQVASLVGELARIPEARANLAKAKASVALVCFLKMRPPGLEDAYQRLEITAAAALTRLCVDPEIARQVVSVGGTDCLPSYRLNDPLTGSDEGEAGLLRYTKSLRRACKKAAKQIDLARAYDCSELG